MDKIYGNKGSRLIDIKLLGINTPSFVIIPSNKVNNYTLADLQMYISKIEDDTHMKFGVNLCVSVRSSSQYIMHGIMTTKLNISTYNELDIAIKSVIQSSNSKKCLWYKKTFNLINDMPFAIIIQQMVYGNKTEYNSGSGVYITRNPITGISDIPYGEFAYNVIGEQIVSGTYTPSQINGITMLNSSLEKSLPQCYNLLIEYGKKLERYYKCVQEIEFTIENGVLYILQTRDAIISLTAIQRILIDLVNENIISDNDAIERLKKYNITQVNNVIQQHIVDDNTHIAKGLASSQGIAIGKILIYNDHLNINEKIIEPIILIAKDTTPEMLPLLQQCIGCLTKYGGSLCHASIVCRALNIPAVTGCTNIIFIDENTISINDYIFHAGDYISINGNNGYIYNGIKRTVNK